MLCNGRTDFTNVKLYQADRVFRHGFGIKALPSEPTLRQRLDEFAPARAQHCLRSLNTALLKQRSFGSVEVGADKLVLVDIDVSPLDNSGSNKEGVSYAYKKHNGFDTSSPTSGLKATCSITNCAQANSTARKAPPRSFAHVSSNSTPSSSTERACFV